MSVDLESRLQLAAPRHICSLPPSVVPPAAWLPAEWADGGDGHVPAFVRQARQLVERHPSSPMALARLAGAELAWDNKADAAAAAQAALKKSTSDLDVSAVVAAAVVLMSSGEVADAERALAAIVLEGSARVLYAAAAAHRHDFGEAVRRLGDEDTADAWSLRGWMNLQIGEFGHAVHAYREVLRRAEPSPETLTNLGLAHALLGELRRAIGATRQALALGPSQRSRVGLNLASYYLAGGEAQEALAVLADLKRHRPTDIEPVFAEAGVHLGVGRSEEALRVLRRARTSLWAYVSDVQQGELTANVAFVRWHLDQQSRQQTAEAVISDLTRIDYRSLRIARMLPVLLPRFSDRDRFRHLLARVRTANPDASLHNLDVHLAVLERRFEDATTLSLEWVRQAPLDPDAATLATFFLTDVRGDYEGAVLLGLEALRRMPAARRLGNNVAYALALAGRHREARRYLMDFDSPQHVATHALLELLSGRPDLAREGYLRAARMAMDADDLDLARLVLLNAEVAFSDFAPDEGPPADATVAPADEPLPEDIPSFALAQCMIERRRGEGQSTAAR